MLRVHCNGVATYHVARQVCAELLPQPVVHVFFHGVRAGIEIVAQLQLRHLRNQRRLNDLHSVKRVHV